jgi:hypothetical protein
VDDLCLHPKEVGFLSDCKSVGVDLIIPTCWKSWRDSERCFELKKQFQIEFDSDLSFGKWLVTQSHKHHVYLNAALLFIWIIERKE